MTIAAPRPPRVDGAVAGSNSSDALDVVIAIPARNEATRIGACLKALSDSAAHANLTRTRAVIVLADNCEDATAQVADALAPSLSFPLIVVETRSHGARAQAGLARRIATDHAARRLEALGAAEGLVMTTDADSRVDVGWIAANAAAIAAGADAVAGAVRYDRADLARLPAALRRRERLERIYARLLARLAARVDPDPHDPWPRHDQASGASLAVRLSWLRAVGGVPPLVAGEDRAFIEALRTAGARIRHEPRARVTTSARLVGRALGGAAETMAARALDADAACDERLEPVEAFLDRMLWRRRARTAHAAALLRAPTFHKAWRALEARSPHLRPMSLAPGDLPREISAALAALRDFNPATRDPCGGIHRDDSRLRAPRTSGSRTLEPVL